jgi:methylglutaconyl-CoA hydratase
MPSILTQRDGPVLRVTLNRPEVRNAFDEEVVAGLDTLATNAAADRQLRALVLGGSGKAFCAGADVAWMAKSIAYSQRENLSDAEDLARMLERLDTLPFPVIGRIHGAALGGGVGLAAICDIAIAAEDAVFALSEVKLGISAARELFLTGSRFGAVQAKQIGLVHEIVPAAELDAAVTRRLAEVMTAGPRAIATAKALIREIAAAHPNDVIGLTTNTIAAQRVSEEGQEGLRAFLEKRKPNWTS